MVRGEKMKEIDLTDILTAFIICAMITLIIFSISSCEAKSILYRAQYKTSIEKCIDSCVLGLTAKKDNDCVNRCFDLEEKECIEKSKIPICSYTYTIARDK